MSLHIDDIWQLTNRNLWRGVPGFYKHYASRNGVIASVVGGGIRAMKPYTPQNGYPLANVGRGKRRRVHELVLLSWKGPCPSGHEARHLDDDKTNNAANNLEWGTHTENMADALGNDAIIRGEGIPGHVLTDANVIEARTLRRSDIGQWTYRRLAGRYGVHPTTIRLAVSVRASGWRHLDELCPRSL